MRDKTRDRDRPGRSPEELARDIERQRDFEGIGYFRLGPVGGRLIIVAEDATATELLPLIDNFEAQMNNANGPRVNEARADEPEVEGLS